MTPVAFLLVSLLHAVLSAPGHLTSYPFVEIFKSPVTKVETVRVTPSLTKSFGSSAAAVAVAGPAVQNIETYSSGDSSNAEIRDLLRSLLFELRGGGAKLTSAPLISPYSQVYDSYGAPPRNTYNDPSAPSYPNSFDNRVKPEKLVVSAPVNEVVRTVFQPVYVPVQYQPEVLALAQPVTQTVPYVTAVPTSVKTGASAVAFSTIHHSPAYKIQQQAYSFPVVQQVQQVATLAAAPVAAAAASAAVVDSSAGGYRK